ncbi:MAG: hypothetical protein JWO46_2274 [Nocardioidaceae bacterium]|nr:hypothetical protein [Nocardioidaceae bacterium]
MRTVMLASVRTYARRYVAAVVAIVVGVAFILVTATLSSATKSGLLADLSASYRGADVVVTQVSPQDVPGTLQQLEKVGPTAVNTSTLVPLAVDGTTVTDEGRLGSVSTATSLRWQKLTSGSWPTGPGQALVDATDAKQNDVKVGDTITAGDGATTVTARVTGLAKASTGTLAASVYLTWPDVQALGDRVFVDNLVVGGGASVDQVRAALPEHAEATSADDYLQAQAKKVTRDVDAVSAMLLVFAGIALFVSIMVIANTFTVLLAQRLRDFALLRCVGATRRQVMRSVRQEALVIGAVSATLGVLVGLGLGRLLVVLLSRLLPALPTGHVSVGWLWIVAAWLVGVLVTFVASVFPARRSTRIDPLAALSPLGAVDVRTRAGIGRLTLGVALIGVGVLALGYSIAAHQLLPMVLGGFASFFGILLFGPVIVPACIRLVGLLTGRFLGVPGRLATANSLRNPRRTAATAASLLVGTTLITAMVTGMATIRHSVDREMDAEYPLDATLTSATSLPAGAVSQVRAVDGIAAATGLTGTTASAGQKGGKPSDVTVLAAPTRTDLYRGHPAFHTPRPRTAYVSWDLVDDLALDTTKPLVLTVGGTSERLRVQGVDGFKSAVLVAPATLAALTADPQLRAVWARATKGADADTVSSAMNALASTSGADAGGGLKNRAYVDLQLDVMVYAVVALLAVALVIALIGIGNTLGLSVLERRREHALLRAMGLTRGQLRATLAMEAVLLAVVTSALGIALGAAYALVGVKAVLADTLGETGVGLSLPWGQLLLVLLVALLSGLAACVLPARQAARIAPAAGLALD